MLGALGLIGALLFARIDASSPSMAKAARRKIRLHNCDRWRRYWDFRSCGGGRSIFATGFGLHAGYRSNAVNVAGLIDWRAGVVSSAGMEGVRFDADRFPDTMGWRAKLGVLTPAPNTIRRERDARDGACGCREHREPLLCAQPGRFGRTTTGV